MKKIKKMSLALMAAVILLISNAGTALAAGTGATEKIPCEFEVRTVSTGDSTKTAEKAEDDETDQLNEANSRKLSPEEQDLKNDVWHYDTEYVFCVELPASCFTRGGGDSISVYYPSKVKAGAESTIIITVKNPKRGETYYVDYSFEAAEDLVLKHGGRSNFIPVYVADDRNLTVEFYTAASAKLIKELPKHETLVGWQDYEIFYHRLSSRPRL